MKISKKVYAAHRKLSECSTNFLEFAENNPESLDRSSFNDLLSDARFDYFQSNPWPTFIGNKTKKEMETAAITVYKLITSIPDRLFSYNYHKISDYFEIPKDLAQMCIYCVDNDYMRSLLGRGDFIISPSGGLRCIEFNMMANFGGWELDLLEPMYINTPIISKFLEEYNVQLHNNHLFHVLLEHVLQTFIEKTPAEHEINIAILFPEFYGVVETPNGAYLQNLYKTVLRQESNRLKGDLFICGFDALKVVDGSLFCGDQKIHILIEMNNGKIPLIFMTAVEKRNLMIYNGPISRIMSNKLNVALLSEQKNSDVFTAEEREAINAYIPWTRKVVPGDTTFGKEKIKLEEFMLSNRERLVLKSSEGFGGYEVYPGRNVSPGEWTLHVEKALRERKWVIQEYIPSASYLYQAGEYGCVEHHAVWGLFIFGSRYGGGFVRILPEDNSSGVINAHQGSEESIILEVGGEKWK